MPPTRAALRFLATLASGYLFLAPQGQLDPPKISDSEAIQAVLKTQQAAWNRGDIAAFLKGYWDSPELTFAGSDGIVRGTHCATPETPDNSGCSASCTARMTRAPRAASIGT